MSIDITEAAEGRCLEIHATGKLTRQDYEGFVPEAERLIHLHGKINILFEMNDFHGWQTGAVWEDVKFDVKHFAHIDRIAMVGDKKWQKGMSELCKAFTTAKIRYFEHTELEQARAWLNVQETSLSLKG